MEVKPRVTKKIRFRKRTLIVAGTVLLLLALMAQSSARGGVGDVYAIKAGRIVTVTGGVIENGTIVIRDGIIEAVGKEIAIPVDAEIIEADTMSVYPGLIDAHTSLALVQPKKKEPAPPPPTGSQPARTEPRPSPTLLSPEKLAAEMLNPKDSKIAKVRETGVTTVLTVPDQGVFIGQSALINLYGDKAEEMILKSPVALHLGYSRQRGVYPSTLMGVIAFQRQTFFDAQHHKFLWGRYLLQKRGWRRPLPNKSLDALIPVLGGRLSVIISANKENEIKRALRLADEFNLDYLISGATEGWRVVDLLKSQRKPVLVSLNFPKPESVTGYPFKLKVEGPSKEKPKKAKPGKEKQREKKKEKAKEEEKKKEKEAEMEELYANARQLYKAGVKFAFTSGGLKKPADFIKNAAKTIEHGLPKEEALKALTINPAQIFGVADQIGSIEEGKIANLVVTTGDIFDEKTSVKYVFVDGKKIEVKKPAKKKKAEGEPSVNVSGTWEVTVDSPQGEVSATLILVQSGAEVTGEFKSEFATASIYDGSVSGNEIEFSVKLPIATEPIELVFYGTVEGNEIEGTIDLGEMGTAKWKAVKPGNWGFDF